MEKGAAGVETARGGFAQWVGRSAPWWAVVAFAETALVFAGLLPDTFVMWVLVGPVAVGAVAAVQRADRVSAVLTRVETVIVHGLTVLGKGVGRVLALLLDG